jgi:hypothetical protein
MDNRMQSLSASFPTPLPRGKQFRHFSFAIPGTKALLPEEHELVVNVQTGHFLVLNWEQDSRYLVCDGLFIGSELSLMLALLNAWPSMVENHKLLWVVAHRPAEQIVLLLQEEETSAEALRLLHQLVEDCCCKTRVFGVDILAVEGSGYKLGRYVNEVREEQG